MEQRVNLMHPGRKTPGIVIRGTLQLVEQAIDRGAHFLGILHFLVAIVSNEEGLDGHRRLRCGVFILIGN